MNNYYIVIFVEGETEEKFYKRFFKNYENFNSVDYKIFNISGIGNFKKDALRKFINLRDKNIKQKLCFNYIVILCYDSDVFERSRKPPVDFKVVQNELKKQGVENIIHFKAIKCIEDLFLSDSENIFKFLKIKPCNISGKDGIEKIKNLYKKVNKIYIKGKTCDLVDYLDVNKIMLVFNREIEKLKIYTKKT